jgi:hypothetical protein
MKPITLFYSYAHEDEDFRANLEKHLSNLKRQGVIHEWHDRKIVAGQSWADEIDSNLEKADVILLLISADFMSSDYCHQVEMKRALERHEQKLAIVVPVLLRTTDLQGSLFEKLQGLPTDFKPIAKWQDKDDAYFDVVKGLRKIIQAIQEKPELVIIPDKPQSNQSKSQVQPENNTRENSEEIKKWQKKLIERLAEQLKRVEIESIASSFANKLREDCPNLPQDWDNVARHLVMGSGDRHKQIAQFLTAVQLAQPSKTINEDAIKNLMSYLLQTLVRQCYGEGDKGLTRIAVDKTQSVELIGAARTTSTHIPNKLGRVEHQNGQKDNLFQNVGKFFAETGEIENPDNICQTMAQELLFHLGLTEAAKAKNALNELEGHLSAFVDDPANAPIQGLYVKQGIGHNPLTIDAVAERLRETLGDLIWLYEYGGQSYDQWLHTKEEKIVGLITRYDSLVAPKFTPTQQSSTQENNMNSGFTIGNIGENAIVNIVPGTQKNAQIGQGNIQIFEKDAEQLLQLLKQLKSTADQDAEVGKQDYAVINQATQEIETEIQKKGGADKSVLTKAKAALSSFKDVASIAGSVEKITELLLPLLG